MSFIKKLKDFFAGLLGGKKAVQEEVVEEKDLVEPKMMESVIETVEDEEEVQETFPEPEAVEDVKVADKVEEPVVETVPEPTVEMSEPVPEEPEQKEDAKEESPLSEALAFAESKLDERKGELSKADIEMFRSKIASFADRVGKDEEAALISVSQLIGGIVTAKKAAPAPKATKKTPAKKKAKTSAKSGEAAKKKKPAKKKA